MAGGERVSISIGRRRADSICGKQCRPTPPSLPPTVPAQGRVRAGAPHASLSDLHRHSLVRSDSLIPRTAPLTAMPECMANFPCHNKWFLKDFGSFRQSIIQEIVIIFNNEGNGRTMCRHRVGIKIYFNDCSSIWQRVVLPKSISLLRSPSFTAASVGIPLLDITRRCEPVISLI